MLEAIKHYARWGLRNDPDGLSVATAIPAFITLAALIGSIL